VRAVEAAPGFTESEVLELAAAAESRSRHPIAASIRRAAASRGLSDGTEDEASEVREIAGRGILATVGGRRVLAGNAGLLEAEGVALPAAPTAAAGGGSGMRDGAGATCDGGALAATSALAAAVRGSTVVHVASDGNFAGRIYIGDAAKEDSAAAIAALAALGVDRSVVLTGDSEEAALPLAAGLGSPEEDAKRLASVDQIIYEKLQAAERDAQEIARKAYEEGFASGEAEGRTFGESQYRAFMQRLEGHLDDLVSAATLLKKASDDELLALALAMAEYLAAQQIERPSGSIRPLLDGLLEQHPFPTPARSGENVALEVYLHPKDLEQLVDTYIGKPGIALKEDPELSRGSLRVEAAEGVLEATLERRRERLLAAIHKCREKGSA